MAEELDVDPLALEAIAGRLTRSANTLDATGATVPAMPDAGDVSGIMGSAIALLTESAGNLVVGMLVAGDQAEAARRGYTAQNEAAANSIRGF
jgi:hypothetical protein